MIPNGYEDYGEDLNLFKLIPNHLNKIVRWIHQGYERSYVKYGLIIRNPDPDGADKHLDFPYYLIDLLDENIEISDKSKEIPYIIDPNILPCGYDLSIEEFEDLRFVNCHAAAQDSKFEIIGEYKNGKLIFYNQIELEHDLFIIR